MRVSSVFEVNVHAGHPLACCKKIAFTNNMLNTLVYRGNKHAAYYNFCIQNLLLDTSIPDIRRHHSHLKFKLRSVVIFFPVVIFLVHITYAHIANKLCWISLFFGLLSIKILSSNWIFCSIWDMFPWILFNCYILIMCMQFTFPW